MKFDVIDVMNRATLFLRKHGPEIMVIGGAAGAVTAGVMACVETTHLPEVNKKVHERMSSVQKTNESGPERGKKLAKAYIENAVDYAKLYAPSCIVGTLSITSILSGNHMLKQRNLALAAAYTTLDASYKQYRGRVAERYGEEAEREIHNGIVTKTVKETVTDENGETHEVEKTVQVSTACSDFSEYFEHGTSKAWEPNHDYNMFFLRLQERLANDMLRSNYVVFLNDVRKMLGMEPTRAGQIVGWTYDPKNAEKYGNDNYISFRIQEIMRPGKQGEDDIVETILLDFNVDGPILDHASEMKKL